MIAFTKWFLRQERKPIRLGRPKDFVVVFGASKERIFAVYDDDNRMSKLVVHTCSPAPRNRSPSRFRAFRRS